MERVFEEVVLYRLEAHSSSLCVVSTVCPTLVFLLLCVLNFHFVIVVRKFFASLYFLFAVGIAGSRWTQMSAERSWQIAFHSPFESLLFHFF